MRNVKSILLMLLCAIVILGAGYLSIVSRGRQILQSESVPERAEYKNAGSNILYGKIDDDIEIFPWNYYPEESNAGELDTPYFLTEDSFIRQFGAEREYAVIEAVNNSQTGEISGQQWEWIIAADSFFGELISYETGVEEDMVFECFQKEGSHILQNMVMADNLSVGSIYFYQDIMDLESKKYQVRIACSDWNVINFICVEYNTEDRREQEEWKQGKKKMVEVLEQSEESLSEYFAYMSQLNDMDMYTIYYLDGETESAYLYSLRWLENIMQGNREDKGLSEEVNMRVEEWKAANQKNTDKDNASADAEEEDVEYAAGYSYQVVELKDMILLLVQGDAAIGLYYDPINLKFCGYNFFYEY